jgi:hypothetical protein
MHFGRRLSAFSVAVIAFTLETHDSGLAVTMPPPAPHTACGDCQTNTPSNPPPPVLEKHVIGPRFVTVNDTPAAPPFSSNPPSQDDWYGPRIYAGGGTDGGSNGQLRMAGGPGLFSVPSGLGGGTPGSSGSGKNQGNGSGNSDGGGKTTGGGSNGNNPPPANNNGGGGNGGAGGGGTGNGGTSEPPIVIPDPPSGGYPPPDGPPPPVVIPPGGSSNTPGTTDVPEPASLLIALAGLAGLATIRRRRRRDGSNGSQR